MRKILLILAILVGCSSGAQAQYVDGNTLYQWCHNDKGAVYAYTLGVYDSIVAHRKYFSTANACVPANSISDQLGDIICKRLTQVPELRHQIAAALVMYYLAQAFPCQN